MTKKMTNGWNKYQKVVIFRLDEQDSKLKSIDEKLDKVSTAVTILKTKAGLIGGVAGLLGAWVVDHWK